MLINKTFRHLEDLKFELEHSAEVSTGRRVVSPRSIINSYSTLVFYKGLTEGM